MDLLKRYFESERGLKPALIRIKRQKMARSPFEFFRGTTVIFYHLWALPKAFRAPRAWICGDAHWENVGSYKGKNHVAYFDLTDFDHACLAPVTLDLGRALTCQYLIGQGRHSAGFLGAYRDSLVEGKPFHIEAEVARGTVARLLKSVAKRAQARFIRRWTKNGRILQRKHASYRLAKEERRWAAIRFQRWASGRDNPEFFSLVDIVGSYAGVGILGHRRYLVLVRGRNAPHLIDMKEAAPSDAATAAGGRQPVWSNEAERIAEVQRMIQYMPIARLGWTARENPSFVMSEFQPAEDRIDSLSLSSCEYEDFAIQWGKLLAWAHLRGGGWRGAATTSELISFGKTLSLPRRQVLLGAARKAARRYHRLYSKFRSSSAAD